MSVWTPKRGARPVLSAELDPVLARKARATVAHNNFSQDWTGVLEVHSEALCRGDLGACGAHVLVAELFDDRLLGERILPTFRHALDHLACNTPAAPVITVPARATIQARLVTSATLELMAATQGPAGRPQHGHMSVRKIGKLRVNWVNLTPEIQNFRKISGNFRKI